MSTDNSCPNILVVLTASYSYAEYVVSRRVRLPHHGTRTG